MRFFTSFHFVQNDNKLGRNGYRGDDKQVPEVRQYGRAGYAITKPSAIVC